MFAIVIVKYPVQGDRAFPRKLSQNIRKTKRRDGIPSVQLYESSDILA